MTDDPLFAIIEVSFEASDRLRLTQGALREIRGHLNGDELTDDAIHDELSEWVNANTWLAHANIDHWDWDAHMPGVKLRDSLKVLYQAIRETPEPPPEPIVGQLDIEGFVYLGRGKKAVDPSNAETPRP